MSEEIKVSIIIPIFNTENYICECINSCLKQTLEQIEIICVDDGSEDNSIKLIQDNFLGDKRIKIIQKNHEGLSIARNVGVNAASGEYLYFLDSDDYIDIKLMQICYEVAKKEGADIVTFDAETIFDYEYSNQQLDFDKLNQRYKNNYKRENDYSKIRSGQELFVQMKQNSEYRCAVWLQFINRKYFMSNNLFFRNIIHEDHLFSLKSFLLTDRIVYLHQELYYRRIRFGSITTSNENINNLKGFFITYMESLDFLTSKINRFNNSTKKMVVNEINNQYARSVFRIAMKLTEKELHDFYETLNHIEKMAFNRIIYSNNLINKKEI